MATRKFSNAKVVLSFLKANRNSFLLKILALTLVTISISCSFFFLDSFQKQFSLNYMNDIKANQSDVSLFFDFSYDDYLDNSSKTIDNFIYATALAGNLSFGFQHYVGNNSLSRIYSQISTFAFSYYAGYNFSLVLININNYSLELLDEYSIEENSSVGILDGGILVLEQTKMKYYPIESSIFNESRIILVDGLTDVSQHNFTIDFHSKVLWDIHDTSLSNKITKIIGQTDYAVVVSDKIFKNYLKFINTTSSMFNIFSNIHLDIDYSTINLDEEILLQNQITQFVLFAQNYIFDEYSPNVDFSFEVNFFSLFDDLSKVLLIINILILTFIIPTILLSLLIFYFSNEYYASKRNKLFSFYYTKGSSTLQLFFFVFSEFAFSLVLSLILGVCLSIPLTMLMIKSPSLFGIQYSSTLQADYSLNISYLNILWIVLIVTIVGLLLVLNNIKPILSQSTDKKELEFDDVLEHKRVFWKSLYFHFLLLLVGICILLLKKVLFQDNIYGFIIQFFVFIVGLLTIIFALSLILLRFVPTILSVIGNYFWRASGKLFSFSTHLFNIRKKILTKNIITFALCVSYLLILIQVVSVIEQFSGDQAYFSVGADARIDFSSDSNITEVTNALPSSIQYTEITKFQIQNFLTGERLRFYVIDPNAFLSVAYFRDNFLNGEPSSDVIEKISQNLTILSNQKIAKSKSWNLGYNYTLTLSPGSMDRLSLQVVDYFHFWPFFTDESEQIEGIPFIIGKDTGEAFIGNSIKISQHFLLNIPDIIDYSQVTSYLKDEVLTSKETLVTLDKGYKQFWSEPFWYVLYIFSIINLYLTGLLFVILSLITSITLENNRKAEIGMFLALGIRRRQIFLLSSAEQLTTLIFGLSLGIVIGLPSSIFLNNQLKLNFSIPIENVSVFWAAGIIILGIIVFNSILINSLAFRTSIRKVTFFIQELELHNESND